MKSYGLREDVHSRMRARLIVCSIHKHDVEKVYISTTSHRQQAETFETVLCIEVITTVLLVFVGNFEIFRLRKASVSDLRYGAIFVSKLREHYAIFRSR